MLTAHHLSKSFDLQVIFNNITFSLNPGERVGLVGSNGCGKTTLLRILAGLETPSQGTISRDPVLRIGYLPQGFEPDPSLTISEIIGKQSGASQELYRELEVAAITLAERPGDAALQSHYDLLVRRASNIETGRAGQILAGLGLDKINPELPVRLLSGGQKTRLSLALVLLSEPQLMLLDEPTNHLDIAMLEWLETWLTASPCASLIVSHDRTFLDNTVRRILEMDNLRDAQCSLHEYNGNYSAYLEQRQAEIEKQWSAYNDQQLEIRRMKADIARTKAQAVYTERQASSIRIGGPDMKIKGFKSYQQGIAKKVAKKAKSRESKLDQYLQSEDRVEKPKRAWQMRLDFIESAHLGRSMLRTENLSIGYHADNPLLSELNLEARSGRRIAITGPNGCGKTTLLRTLNGQLAPLAGAMFLGPSAHLGYMSQDQSSLDPQLTVVETLLALIPNETRARTFLSLYLFTGDEPLKPVSLLSYGQRARLMLALLVAQGCNLLLLDEPINHLDIPSRTQFEAALSSFEGAVLAVVHDRYFIERFADEIWQVEGKGMRIG